MRAGAALQSLLILFVSVASAIDVKVGTFNIRRASITQSSTVPKKSWVEYPWTSRRELIANQVKSQGLDIVGFQEVQPHQMDDLVSRLGSKYGSVFRKRNDRTSQSEGVPVFWSKSLFSLIEVQYFWLSKTPKQSGSKSWDASKIRMATMVHLKARKNKQFRGHVVVINTHLDGDGQVSRKHAAQILLKRATSAGEKKYNGQLPLIILTGDLNAGVNDASYKTLTGDRYMVWDTEHQGSFIDLRQRAGVTAQDTGTGFGRKPVGREIDHIFVLDNPALGNHWEVSEYKYTSNIAKTKNGKSFRISDHRMVVATLNGNATRGWSGYGYMYICFAMISATLITM